MKKQNYCFSLLTHNILFNDFTDMPRPRHKNWDGFSSIKRDGKNEAAQCKKCNKILLKISSEYMGKHK